MTNPTTAEKVREPECTLGVGDGSGQLFVHGSYEAIKAVQAIILRAERLTAELASLQRERDADAALLDWLDGFTVSSHYTLSEYFSGKVRVIELSDEDGSVIACAPTVREAIDSGMAFDTARGAGNG